MLVQVRPKLRLMIYLARFLADDQFSRMALLMAPLVPGGERVFERGIEIEPHGRVSLRQVAALESLIAARGDIGGVRRRHEESAR